MVDARRLWTDPSAPSRQFEIEYVNGDVLFSSLVAHAARLFAGGADISALRASLGLTDDAEAHANLDEVRATLRARESKAYAQVMQQDQQQ